MIKSYYELFAIYIKPVIFVKYMAKLTPAEMNSRCQTNFEIEILFFREILFVLFANTVVVTYYSSNDVWIFYWWMNDSNWWWNTASESRLAVGWGWPHWWLDAQTHRMVDPTLHNSCWNPQRRIQADRSYRQLVYPNRTSTRICEWMCMHGP